LRHNSQRAVTFDRKVWPCHLYDFGDRPIVLDKVHEGISQMWKHTPHRLQDSLVAMKSIVNTDVDTVTLKQLLNVLVIPIRELIKLMKFWLVRLEGPKFQQAAHITANVTQINIETNNSPSREKVTPHC
jgi:hypothetical protein